MPMNRPPPAAIDDDGRWHLDKRVPIALIASLALQFGASVWYAGKLSQRQDEQERRIGSIEQQNISGRLGVLESQVSDVKGGVRDINAKLDKLIETRR